MANERTIEKVTPEAIERATVEIDKALEQCSIETLKELPAIKQAVVLAKGVQMLRAALPDKIVAELFMPLQGTKLGFRTDRDNAKEGPREYPIPVVRECAIEAMIRGFRPVGNEFNIIGANFYATKEGLDRKLRELDGVTNIEHHPGVPSVSADGKSAVVPYRVKLVFRGEPLEFNFTKTTLENGVEIDQRIPIRVNAGQGPDAILGKARRKALARVYDRLTGSNIETPEGDVADAEAFTTTGTEVTDERPSQPPAPGKQSAAQALDAEIARRNAKKNGADQVPAAQPESKSEARQREPGED